MLDLDTFESRLVLGNKIPLTVQAVLGNKNTKVTKLPPLTLTLAFYETNVYARVLTESRYIVRVSILYTKTRRLMVPNRVTSLCLRSGLIRCINTNVYRQNTTGPETRLPMCILEIDLCDTCIYKSPRGYFISLSIDSDSFVKYYPSRESLLAMHLWIDSIIMFMRLLKSIMDINIPFYSRLKRLRESRILNTNVYNVYYRVTKRNRRKMRGFSWFI